jgi:hypothetical protein
MPSMHADIRNPDLQLLLVLVDSYMETRAKEKQGID